jgi:hypothetical protein
VQQQFVTSCICGGFLISANGLGVILALLYHVVIIFCVVAKLDVSLRRKNPD